MNLHSRIKDEYMSLTEHRVAVYHMWPAAPHEYYLAEALPDLPVSLLKQK